MIGLGGAMLNDNLSIAKKLYKSKKHIVVSTIFAMALSLLYTFIIKPTYTSSAFVYPSSLATYGEESQAEQLLQFLQSDEMPLYLIRRLSLAKHYKIDTTKEGYLLKLRNILSSKIQTSKTKYESIEIKASDFNADTAKLLVTEIIDGVNWLIEKEHKEKYSETVKNSLIYLQHKKYLVDSTQNLLNDLNKKYEYLNIGIQLKEAFKNQYKMQSGGGSNSLSDYINMSEQLKTIESDNKGKSLSELITSINNYSLQYGKLTVYFDDQVREWTKANDDYQKNLFEYNRKINFVAVASAPLKPLQPSWPKRWIIVPLSGMVVFILSCIYFLYIDNIRLAYAKITEQ
ncbi:MAG TPA: Wzz/FepE/Etk N-terminal domain-containing protein [Bacteroidia bacterium]|nr:Wzz/FepE/Etk N-terminal domain-containing protein [Bacteroidia bacterium]